jgi:regulator of sigma E protease
MTLISFFYVILAILGLSFLIFIHELGHYYMARRVGMRVDTFSIGFGKPIYSWMKDGVRWQIGWLIFGGYVKIGGMDTPDSQEEKDGFFSKSPLDRIKVALMGPLVNIVFAFLIFTTLWMIGGREKKFSDYTHKIGWIDPKSELYQKGLRPGDEINSYNGKPFQGAKDHLTAPMMADGLLELKGYHYNANHTEKRPFDYSIKPYAHPAAIEQGLLTSGILGPAHYLIYQDLTGQKESELPENSPMRKSGIEKGDRIIWVDGVELFSLAQLSHILNDGRVLLTIQRNQQTFLRRVPRVMAEELRLDPLIREELIDWQFEAGLNSTKISKLFTLPYNLNHTGTVEAIVKFIDHDKEEEAFPKYPDSQIDLPLEPGDKIIAVDGIPVQFSYEILANLQDRHVNLIVERDTQLKQAPSWTNADEQFDHQYNQADLKQLVMQIGTQKGERQAGNLILLNPIVPKTLREFYSSQEKRQLLDEEIEEQKKEIEKIDDPEKRAQAKHHLESLDRQYMLGLPSVNDLTIKYNPDPIELFSQVFNEIFGTLKALFTGALSPKWMSGPIGIVQVVHENAMSSLKEALYWLGAISLNLGVLNLLPLPVLDGGTIAISLFELITRRRLKAKTLERLIVPFAVLLIAFFIFLTYYDLARLFSRWHG